MVTIRIPKSKGKVDNRVVSKRRYVFYFVNALMENALTPVPKNEIHALSERITDLVLRKAGKMEIVKVTVSPKYCGYTKIADKTVGVYDFTLTIHVKDKVISVYEIKRNFDNRLFDIRFRAPRNNNDFANFVDIANFVRNHNSVMPRFDMPDNFADIANYVMDYVMTYGKERKREINVYAYANSIREFLAFLNQYTDIFNDRELRELIGKRYVYYWYRYLRNSGYFTVYHGGIE